MLSVTLRLKPCLLKIVAVSIMPRRNTRERLQRQLATRRIEKIFGSIENVVQPENIGILRGLSDEEIIELAMENIPDVCDIIDHLPDTMKHEVREILYENPPPEETCHAYVTLVNTVLPFRKSYDECQALFPTCTPTFFGSWFAPVTSCQMSKMWLPQIQEPEEEQIQEESEGFETCEEAEPDEEP